MLTDVQNLRWIRSRALRRGVWNRLNLLEKYIVNLTIRTLERVRSEDLLNTLLKIVEKLLDRLITRYEARLLNHMEQLKQKLLDLAVERRSASLYRLAQNLDYLWTQAIKNIASEDIGAYIHY
jgi:hypothetical protein